MKTCPYCSRSYPEGTDRCPACGAFYWEANRDSQADFPAHTEEEQGCLAIILFHILIAFGFAVFLIVLGFAINLLIHFEANQMKIALIGASLFLGGLLSLLVRNLKMRRIARRQNNNQNPQ